MAAGPMRRKSNRCSRDSTGAAVDGDLLRLGGGEHEHHPRRRLLEDLEQRIPRLAREHVRLVHDVDLVVALLRRGVHGALAQFARVIHAAMARRVDLDHVESRRAAPGAAAVLALAARFALGRSRLAQLSAMARMRAAVVLPTPRGPVRR